MYGLLARILAAESRGWCEVIEGKLCLLIFNTMVGSALFMTCLDYGFSKVRTGFCIANFAVVVATYFEILEMVK